MVLGEMPVACETLEMRDDSVSAGTARSPWLTPVVKRFAAGRAESGSSLDGGDGGTAKS